MDFLDSMRFWKLISMQLNFSFWNPNDTGLTVFHIPVLISEKCHSDDLFRSFYEKKMYLNVIK